MSIVAKINSMQASPRLYTVRADISEESPSTMRLTFTKDAFAIVNMTDIHPDFIFPLARGEDPSGRNSKCALKLIEGAVVELHVDTLVHKFRLAVDEKPFVIDEVTLKVVYLDLPKAMQDCEYGCRKYVTVVDVYCCGGGFTQAGYGYVGCIDGWCDENRCCPDRRTKANCGCK